MALAPNPIRDMLADKTPEQVVQVLTENRYLIDGVMENPRAVLQALERAQGQVACAPGGALTADLDSLFLAVHPYLNERALLVSLPAERSRLRWQVASVWLSRLNPAAWSRAVQVFLRRRSRRARREPPEIHRAGLALELASALFFAEHGRSPEAHESWEIRFSWTVLGCHAGRFAFRGFDEVFRGQTERDGTMAVERIAPKDKVDLFPGRRRSGAPEGPRDLSLAHRMMEFALLVFAAEEGHWPLEGTLKSYAGESGRVSISDRRIEWQGAWGRFVGSAGEAGNLCSVHFMSELLDP